EEKRMRFNPGAGNMNQMMKQAQKLQQDMLKAKEELEVRTVEASSGGGVVEAVVNGKMELVSIKIKPEAFDPGDIEMLEDLVKVAVNQGVSKAREMTEREMAKLTGGMNIPGLF
ncbi:MAG: YbaB/EbfC family nucleoid-associated protein, partial [Eubacteriales bacterium]